MTILSEGKKLNTKKQINISQNVFCVLGENNNLKRINIKGSILEIQHIQFKIPLIIKTEIGRITIEDLENHPMSLANRWGILKDVANYKLSDHQKRFIVTLEESDIVESYVLPKIFNESEPVARVSIDKNSSYIPFNIEMAEIKNGKINSIPPQEPKKHSKIILATQILGHVQDAANIMRWAQKNGTLQNKWKFALPATKRTEITKQALREENIPVNEVTIDWSYAGGKDFRTGLEYKENFNKKESFSTVSSFIAANAKLCIDIAKGQYAIFSTNFKAEAQLIKKINPHIITSGITHTFLSGDLNKRIELHHDLPRFYRMLKHVQQSLDNVQKRIVSLGGDKEYIDYYCKISKEKMLTLDSLLYRTINSNSRIYPPQNNTTQIIKVPVEVPNKKISKEKAKKNISKIIDKNLLPTNKVIIFAGVSDDGSFRKRLQEILIFAKKHPKVHILIPLKNNDERISQFNIPENTHTIGFRKNWRELIAGADVTFIRGSWGELIDLIISETVPIITSPGSVPMDADLDTTQFLTQVSEERACNISLLIEELQKQGVKKDIINGLLVDFNNLLESYSLQEAIEHALLPNTLNEIKRALSNINRGGLDWVGKLHEKLLEQKIFLQ